MWNKDFWQLKVMTLWPRSEPDSCAECEYAWENPGCWLSTCPWSAAACYRLRCRSLCDPPLHWGTKHGTIWAEPQEQQPGTHGGHSSISGAPCVHVVPAVHQDWPHVRSACRWGAVDEGEDGEGVLGYSHVRPLSVVILDNDALV